MKDLIRKVLKEEINDDLSWVHEIPKIGDLSPGTIYHFYGLDDITKPVIASNIVKGFHDLEYVGDKIILTVDGYCDFKDLFYDDSSSSSEGYVNKYLAERLLCDEDNWWEPYYVSDLINNWKTEIWDDKIVGDKDMVNTVLSHIKKYYVSKTDYNPKQLNIFGELPPKQNVIELEGRVLDEEYFNELVNDLNKLGELIDEEDEFEELKKEIGWAYGDAYNTAARDEIYRATIRPINEFFGKGQWASSEKNSSQVLKFDVTELFWTIIRIYFDNCIKDCVSFNERQGFDMEDFEVFDEHCEECTVPSYNYSYFIDLLKYIWEEDSDLFNPRFQHWPDDDDVEKYFKESLGDRI